MHNAPCGTRHERGIITRILDRRRHRRRRKNLKHGETALVYIVWYVYLYKRDGTQSAIIRDPVR